MTKITFEDRATLFANIIFKGRINFKKLLHIFCENYYNSFNFIQVGAFDGKSHDFLYDFVTQSKLNKFGILVEPIPEYFIKLKSNYREVEGMNYENYAIHNDKASIIMYKIKEEYETQVPDYILGCASIFEEHFKSHLIDDRMIEKTSVPAINVNQLIQKYNCYNYNLIQIDTEGYDTKIINSLNFNKYKIDIIKFEHINLTSQEIIKTILYLFKRFYLVARDGDDLIAIKVPLFLKFLFFRND